MFESHETTQGEALPAREGSTKDHIFRAAVGVFAEKGFAAATVREICARAGANVAAVNYHFGSKEKLYAAVLDFVMAGPGERAAQAVAAAAGRPPEERLAAFVRASVHSVYQNREGFAGCEAGAVFLFEMARPSPGLDLVVERYLRPDAQALGGTLRELLGPAAGPKTVRACAESVMGQILYHCTIWPITQRLIAGRPMPEQSEEEAWMDDLAEHILRFSLAGIAAVRQGLPPGRGPAAPAPADHPEPQELP